MQSGTRVSVGSKFFFAGARPLLVTTWAVESDSAKLLMVGTFKAMQRTNVSKARALADTQWAMLNGQSGDRYRRPLYWAPQFFIGDAAR